MSDTTLQVIHIPFKTDLNGRSWIDRNEEYLSAIPNITKEEWMNFYDRIDYSLNQDAQPKFEKTISEENKEGCASCLACIFLVFMCFLGGGCDPSCGGGSGTPAEINQPMNIKACMKELDSESKRRETLLFQLVIDGTIEGGGYVLYVKCTLKKENTTV
ncbi:predicted protein [Chaetoceros tenuissimus]|uniref:Uncharacterized protein n=1 Tax=Chaetoceros tenuissimus TaxID=426638 RepID=A0AAD3D0G0_9STRA|nr:predicted protein [Chaetoceros tenuissimus]